MPSKSDRTPAKEELEKDVSIPDTFENVMKAALQPTKEWKEKQEKKGR